MDEFSLRTHGEPPPPAGADLVIARHAKSQEPQVEAGVTTVLLLANERSGTHYLRSALESSGLICARGEVCNADAESKEASELSFFRFKSRHIGSDSELALPTVPHQMGLLDAYFDFLGRYRVQSGKAALICDIKYSHLHNFNGFWWDLFSPPFLIDYARTKNIKILHLVRHNAVKTAFSDLYAQKTGVWRSRSSSDVVSVGLKVDAAALKARAQRIQGNIDQVRQWVSNANALEVDYDAIVGEGRLEVLNTIMSYLGLPRRPRFESAFVKTTPPYESIITNYDEVRNLFA